MGGEHNGMAVGNHEIDLVTAIDNMECTMFLTKYMSYILCVCVCFFFILFVCQLFHLTVTHLFVFVYKFLGYYPLGFPRTLHFILGFQGHCILYWFS